MKLSELIAAYGDDKIAYQKLDDDIQTLNFNHKTGTKITFGTSEPLNAKGTQKMGLVVWMDRNRVHEIIENS